MNSGESVVLDFRSRSLTKPWVYGAQDSAPQEQAVRTPCTWIWFSVPVQRGIMNSFYFYFFAFHIIIYYEISFYFNMYTWTTFLMT